MNLRCVSRGLLGLVLAAAGAGLSAQSAQTAQPADPLNTPQCRAARTRLDVAQTAAVGRSEAGARALQAARARVARTCFGSEPDTAQQPLQEASRTPAPQDIRAPHPTVQVPPVTGVAAAPDRHGAPVAPEPPVALPRAAVITQCDPTGCWDSTGRRLNRVGPGLAGPGGPCTVQGTAAMCP